MDKNPKMYYSKELIELLKREMEKISPSTLHKLMNPYCMECMFERGWELIHGPK